jgi:hypothetical protein
MYSAKTQFILNEFTLTVKEDEIRRRYDNLRCQRFDELFKPTLALVTIFLVYRICQVVVLKIPYLRVIYAAQQVAFVILWYFLRKRWKRFMPIITFFYSFIVIL